MSQTDSKLLVVVLEVIITIVVPVLGSLVAVLINRSIQKVKLQMSTEQLIFIDMLIKRFVAAAQQYDLTGQLVKTGEEKKAWVIEKLQEQLTLYRIPINVDYLAHMIEAAILDGAKIPALSPISLVSPLNTSTPKVDAPSDIATEAK